MCSPGGIDGTTSCKSLVHIDKFGKTDRLVIGKSQRLCKEVHAGIIKVSAIRPGLARKI
jgi:hypothetical protein